MADIFLDLPINATPRRVFEAISTPGGLDTWWTESAAGTPGQGAEYLLRFGPEYHWRGRITGYVPDSFFELELTDADDDWRGTRIGVRLEPRDGKTWVRFSHTGWPANNEHYRVSCNCWAAYLRVLRRSLEHGESVAYERRLDV